MTINNPNRKDYTGNREAAFELAKKLQDYYHKRGFTDVRVWVEPELFGMNDNKIYGVRSNIVFTVPTSV